MSSRLIPKNLTTGIVRPRDTEDLEAPDASARALTSALCGALPSMPTLKVDERPWLSLSVLVLDVDDKPQSQEQNTYKQYSDAHGLLRLYPDGRKNRVQMRSGTDDFATAQFSDGIAFSTERQQMSSKLPVSKATIGCESPSSHREPTIQADGVQTISSSRHMASCRRQADGSLNRHRCLGPGGQDGWRNRGCSLRKFARKQDQSEVVPSKTMR